MTSQAACSGYRNRQRDANGKHFVPPHTRLRASKRSSQGCSRAAGLLPIDARRPCGQTARPSRYPAPKRMRDTSALRALGVSRDKFIIEPP